MGVRLPIADFVPLAGWALAVATFVAGTIVPVVYRRLAFEGISLQQAHNVRVVSEAEANILTFSAILKIANVGRGPVLLDRIRAPDRLPIEDVELDWIGTELKLHSPGAPVTLPPSHAKGGEDFLPVVIASPGEKIIAIGFRFSYPPGDSPAMALSRHVERYGLTAGLRINGKYRDYTLTIGRTDRSGRPPVDEATPAVPDRSERSVVSAFAERDLAEAVLAGELRGAQLAGRDLSGTVLNDADLRGADLSGADLRETVLNHADLRGANLAGTDLREAVLNDGDLRSANLEGADLREAVLNSADVRGARLADANLDTAVLNHADLRGAAYTYGTRWPSGFDPARAGAVSSIKTRTRTRALSGAGLVVANAAAIAVGADDDNGQRGCWRGGSSPRSARRNPIVRAGAARSPNRTGPGSSASLSCAACGVAASSESWPSISSWRRSQPCGDARESPPCRRHQSGYPLQSLCSASPAPSRGR